ncbi:sensor histidine kinase [Qipengyuania spongiae]|uniref:histidine kinase n=1 Tax=Qipengyuania spongiae TaxID=2909673 RepID=A0ABY5T3W1_9SPHN|nr:HAMP domain-containing sensor histidine kinase [Qipengyuania spongiae]UVI40796.1 HAMP domain-containing histidine kinase [Qipengyuania spongiae]
MMAIAAGWIFILLLAGGFALDRTLTNLVEDNFDDQLEYMLTAMISSAELDNAGDVYFIRPMGDQRFLEPNSGLYWQISGEGREDYPSRSLWDRSLEIREYRDDEVHLYDSRQIATEPMRIAERSVMLPGSDTRWWFAVAASREEMDYQIARIRSILIWSFAVLGLGLFGMAVLQNWVGLGPLRRVRAAIQKMRSTGANRIEEPLPLEVEPLVEEINALLAHTTRQAEEARTHAGNLAHALKTPLTVLTNAATAHADDLAETTIREARTMQRHVDHHLARARAVGRRAVGHARTSVCESAEAVRRAVERLYSETRFDIAGNRGATVAIERQDLDEILGNLIENAAKYGGGSVFVTVDAEPGCEQCVIWVEDDGMGIPEEQRTRIFDRGARLDTGKPGTGLGLAIVRDVAEIYGGSVELTESEDLGGLMSVLSLPRADQPAASR